MALKNDFEKAVEDVQKLKEKPDNSQLLELYSLFKQGTVGDASGQRPRITNIRARKKFDAWSDKKGTSKDQAMRSYIDLVKRLQKW